MEFDEVQEVEEALTSFVGSSVERPKGTLSGHAAGLPFEDKVHQRLVAHFGRKALRHFEVLNNVYLANPKLKSAKQRIEALGPPSLQRLLSRGEAATKAWTVTNQFKEKQNDTAESVVLSGEKYVIEPTVHRPILLLDVKTQDADKAAQPPNIISAKKLASACRTTLESEDFLPFRFVYVAVRWSASPTFLTCTDLRVVSLTRIEMGDLYINWAAATQLQFHPFEVSQTYSGGGLEWARDFLEAFCKQYRSRISKEGKELAGFENALANYDSGNPRRSK